MPGAGSVIYRGLAVVIVGGLAFSTLFTIVLLPCLLRLSKQDFMPQSLSEKFQAKPLINSNLIHDDTAVRLSSNHMSSTPLTPNDNSVKF